MLGPLYIPTYVFHVIQYLLSCCTACVINTLHGTILYLMMQGIGMLAADH